ncbi:MAG: ElyC/SanA/YdcF family protein [Candidatus Omnitrophota bacterium]
MLKNENIICISSIDWDFVWQGHQEIMSTFAKNGNRVLFIENTGVRSPGLKDIPRLKKRILNWIKGTMGFRKEEENIYIYSPVILPFPYSKIARWINRFLFIGPLLRWIKATQFHNPIIWTFLPTGIALDIVNNVDNKLLVYYCIADFYELLSKPHKVKKTEDELIKRCDLIFAQGKILEQKCKLLNNNVHIFPFGVKMEAFDKFNNNPTYTPKDIEKISKPIIGYVGGIHRHIDFELLRFIAKSHPEWSIVLVGPIQTDVSALKNLHNIFLLGQKNFSELPAYINQFDVGIVPYEINPFTMTVIPTKLNEYHAMGKAVVTTDLPEVRNFNVKNGNLVNMAKTYEEFSNCILEAFKAKSAPLLSQRIQSARDNSWIVRIERMSSFIEKSLEEKKAVSLNWQNRLLQFYRTSSRKALKFAIVLGSIYLLLFYTPFIWYIAEPLKIINNPNKADVIVVFAAGVGESGRAGQGYEERVQYGVQLYNKGYAEHLIFSSGYKFIYEEPMLMKVLAVSLGVPQEAIILEEKATNTYENVKFTDEILKEKKWDSILLVSSPYHMLRAGLVFKKNAKGVKVSYAPILRSLYYDKKDGIKLRHIRGIIHEYLGIIYYLMRGYI